MSDIKIHPSGYRTTSVKEAAEWEALQIAKSVLLSRHPFFAALLLDRMRIVLSDDLPTLATDGVTIIVGRKFFEELTVQERVFVLCHEILHALMRHAQRGVKYHSNGIHGTKFIPLLWNLAIDFIVNDTLVQGNVGKMPEGGLHDQQWSYNHSAEEVYAAIYNMLPPQARQPQGSASDGSGNSSGDDELRKKLKAVLGDGDVLDEHLEPAEYSDTTDIEWKQAVKAAAERAKSMGKLPGSLTQFVEEFLEPQVPWTTLLRQTLVRLAARDEATWNRPHRRRLTMHGIYTPGRQGFGAGEVWIWLDTSGSISQAEYSAYFGECSAILSECRPERLVLGFCDAQVNRVEQLDQPEDLADQARRIPGGGGTDFRPPWEYMRAHGARPDAVVYLTDMYGPFPDDSPWPTIWVATSDVVGPFGTTIQLQLDNS